MDLSHILSSAGIGSLAAGALIWIARNWIREHLIYSVRYRSEATLRELEDSLKRKTDETLIRLESQLNKDIELAKLRLGPYTIRQYEAYSTIWHDLIDINFRLKDLCKKATREQFSELDSVLSAFGKQIRKSALLIESKHYQAIHGIIKDCIDVQTGREMVQDLYREGPPDPSTPRRVLVNEASEISEKMKTLQAAIDSLMEDLRKHIQGEQ